MADRPPNALRVFNVTSPEGEQFRAAAIGDGNGYRAVSNSSGEWASDSRLTFADLMHPEHKLSNWDIEPDDEGEGEDVRPDGRPSFGYLLNQAREKIKQEAAGKSNGKTKGKDAVAQGPGRPFVAAPDW
jgi:hypothetical protein